MHDVGRNPSLTPDSRRDIEAYQTALANHGITIEGADVGHPAVELMVVLDEWKVAGTLDRIVRCPGFARPLIADLKTGRSLEYSWHSIAVQLAIYAHADALYAQGGADDGSEDERYEMAPVDQRWALIFWLPAGSGTCKVYGVDIEAGWEAFKLAMATREWHKNKTLSIAADELFTAASEVAANAEPCTCEPPLTTSSGAPASDPGCPIHGDNSVDRLPPPPPEDLTPLLAESLERKIGASFPGTTVVELGPTPEVPRLAHGAHRPHRWPSSRSGHLAPRWPEGVPTLRQSTEHTAEQLGAIEAVLDIVEGHLRLPFADPRPGSEPLGDVIDLFGANDKKGPKSMTTSIPLRGPPIESRGEVREVRRHLQRADHRCSTRRARPTR